MHPAGAAAAEAEGGPLMDVRAAARANVILGLAMAAIALLAAATISPGAFRAQIIEQAAPAPGAQRCAAQPLAFRGGSMELVVMGVVRAVFGVAIDVGVARTGLPGLGRFLSTLADLIGVKNACHPCYDVAIGSCAGQYLTYLVIGYVLVVVSCAVLRLAIIPKLRTGTALILLA